MSRAWTLDQNNAINAVFPLMIIEMTTCLQKGEVSAKPIFKNYSACDRCNYFPICCYESDMFCKITTNVLNKKALEKIIEKDE